MRGVSHLAQCHFDVNVTQSIVNIASLKYWTSANMGLLKQEGRLGSGEPRMACALVRFRSFREGRVAALRSSVSQIVVQ